MHQLIACDFDGTLFNTDIANLCAYNEALSEHGYEISYEYYKEKCDGKNYKVFLPQIIGIADESVMSKIHNYKKKCYSSYYSLITPNENLFTILKKAKNKNKIAIVTTATGSSVKEILETFHMNYLFDFIIAKEDVKNLKPNPEGYITAMRMANAIPKTTIIYEDSSAGVKAAKLSGAKVNVIKDFSVQKEKPKITVFRPSFA